MKAKKKSKRLENNNESHIKALASFLILCVGAGVFMIFYRYKDSLMTSSDLQPFLLLTVLLGAFLIGLLYLINPKR